MSNQVEVDQFVTIRPDPWVYVKLGLPCALILIPSTRGPDNTTVVSGLTVCIIIAWALMYTWIASHRLSVTSEELEYDAWFTKRTARLEQINSAIIRLGKLQTKQDVAEMRLIVSDKSSESNHFMINARVVLFRKKDVDKLLDALRSNAPSIEIGRAKSMVSLVSESLRVKK